MLEKWDEILNTVKIEEQISDISYEVWIRPLKPGKVDAHNHILEVQWSGDLVAIKYNA